MKTVKRLIFGVGIALILFGAAVFACRYRAYSILIEGAAPLLPPAGQVLAEDATSFNVAFYGDFCSRVEAVEEISKRISESDAVFAVCLGDMVRKRTNFDFLHVLGEMQEYLTIPLYTVPGNWDRYKYGRDWDMYHTYFGQDYYFFGYGDTLFIMLNNAKGDLNEEQRRFLAQTLRRERGRFKRCVIACHMPPLDPLGEDHCMEQESSEKLWTIIEPYDVDMIISGHVHDFAEMDFHGVKQVTVPSSGQKIDSKENLMYGFVNLAFQPDGSIDVEERSVTDVTGLEQIEYFFTVTICQPDWFFIGLGCLIGGGALLYLCIVIRLKLLRSRK